MKKRLDQLLVDKGLAPSKTKAQEMIERGEVYLKPIHNQPLTARQLVAKNAIPTVAKKPAQMVDENLVAVTINEQNLLKYVSRAGFKLEAALRQMNLSVDNLRALDIGQSTGGFTDCLLQHGCKHVVGVDVATDELHPSLRNHSRITPILGVNAREIQSIKHVELAPNTFDLVVMDISFISIKMILPVVVSFLRSGGFILALVKPQFEVGSVNLSKKGIVKSLQTLANVQESVVDLAQKLGFVHIQYFPSQLKGRDGNQEFFLYGVKKG